MYSYSGTEQLDLSATKNPQEGIRRMIRENKEDRLMLQSEPTCDLCCRYCLSQLVANPEWESGDWFIRCLVCGARNVLAISIEIVGWRRENSSAIRV